MEHKTPGERTERSTESHGDRRGRRGAPYAARRRMIAAFALSLVAFSSAACSSSDPARSSSPPADPSTPSSSQSSTVSPPSSSAPVVTTASIEQTVQKAWLGYWKVALSFESAFNASQWSKAIDGVAVNPIRNQLVVGASKDRAENLVGYGYIVSRPYWPTPPSAGSETVVMGDCFDGTHAGLKFKTTGKTHSVGTPRTNVHATLVKGADDKWRVEQIEYLKASC